MSDLKRAILEIQDKKIEKVTVPEWIGIDVYVRSVNAHDGLLVSDKINDASDPDRFAWIAACVMCDADGVQIFDPTDPEDIKGLSGRSIKALITVVNAAADLNALDASEEEAEKN